MNITIDLSASREATHLPSLDQLIQQDALKQFKRLLRETCDRIDATRKRVNTYSIAYPRTHDVITIDGKRGAGKTTFVLTLLELIQSEKLYQPNEKATNKKLYCLRVIDPTLIETREHILLAIITQIKNKVEQHLSIKEARLQDPISINTQRDNWENTLRKLARGLSNLKNAEEDRSQTFEPIDPQYFLEEGLKNAKDGFDFEQNFHSYVEQSLAILEHDAFVLALDDIDTDSKKGWPVLEVIRKYLTTPRLIVILLGDLELYSNLVQCKQWERLGLDQGTQYNRDKYGTMVDGLVEQYLLKILNPARRIELRYVDWYVNTSEYNINIIRNSNENTNSISLKSIIEILCKSIFNQTSKKDLLSFSKAILNQPARTIVQMLYMYATNCDESWNIKKGLESNIIDGMAHIYLHSLKMYGGSVSELDWKDDNKAASRLTVALGQSKLLNEAFDLLPVHNNSRINETLLVWGAAFTRALTGSPYLMFDYFIRVCLTHEVITTKNSPRNNSHLEFKSYCEFVNLNKSMSSLGIARRHAAYISPTLNTGFKSGIIWLYGDSRLKSGAEIVLNNHYATKNGGLIPRDKHIASFFDKTQNIETDSIWKYAINTLSSLQGAITSPNRPFVGLPFSRNLTPVGDTPSASFFSLIGALSRLLQTPTKQLTAELHKISQIRGFNARTFEREDLIDTENTFESNNTYTRETHSDSFSEAFSKWRPSFIKAQKMPISLLAKIWTRFYYSMKRVDSETSARDSYVGYIIHRYIIILFNSMLIEEIRYLYPNDVINFTLTNPTSSDAIFIRNYNNYMSMKSFSDLDLPLFDSIFSCPYWGHYINSDSEIYTNYINSAFNNAEDADKIYKTTYVNSIEFPNLYPVLNSLAVRRPRNYEPPSPPSPTNSTKLSFDHVTDEDKNRVKGRRQPTVYKQIILNEKDYLKRYWDNYRVDFADIEKEKEFIRINIATPILRAYGVIKTGLKRSKNLDTFVKEFKRLINA